MPDAGAPAPTPTWMALDRAGDVAPGELRTVTLRGAELIVANVEGTLLAYRSACAGCGAGLGDATLERGRSSRARAAGARFDLPRAGRALGAEQAQLEPGAAARSRRRGGEGGAGAAVSADAA